MSNIGMKLSEWEPKKLTRIDRSQIPSWIAMWYLKQPDGAEIYTYDDTGPLCGDTGYIAVVDDVIVGRYVSTMS